MKKSLIIRGVSKFCILVRMAMDDSAWQLIVAQQEETVGDAAKQLEINISNIYYILLIE